MNGILKRKVWWFFFCRTDFFIWFFKYFAIYEATGVRKIKNQWSDLGEFFFKLRLLIRLSQVNAGKCNMTSFSFSSTITIPNFKPISLTVVEFWKRYHHTHKSASWRLVHKISYQAIFVCAIIFGSLRFLHTHFAWNIVFRTFS